MDKNNYLDSDEFLCGFRWPLIAQNWQGKTEEEVKMIWNTKLKKKLSQMGVDHVTHRPFSHVLAEYGNINGVGILHPNPLNLPHLLDI